MKTYRIEMTPDQSSPIEQREFTTLTAARKALRKVNGGRLFGRFIPEGNGVEGWNLAKNEGCNAAVIVRAN